MSWITAGTFGALYKVCRVLECAMTSDDAQLIDETLDLVHQREGTDQE